MNSIIGWFNQSSHHRSILIFGSLIALYFIWEYLQKGKAAHKEVVIAAILGAAAVEGLKSFAKTQGASTG